MASRKEQKEALRREREERERAAAAAGRRRRRMGYAIAGVLVAAVAIAAIAIAATSGGGGGGGGAKAGLAIYPKGGSVPPPKITSLPAAAKAAGCTLKSYPSFGRQHVPGPVVNYRTNPPTSGPHNSVPASDGAYTQAPRTEQLVHALEHGRIIIQFRPSAPPKVRADLKALFDQDPRLLILTPNATGMPYEVAATAWRHLLGCPQMNPRVFDALRDFRAAYTLRAPEQIPQPE